MQSPEIFIAQNPQTRIREKDPGRFIARNGFRKNLTITVISGIGGSQCKLSLKIYEEK